jgi:hypothetical protein
MEYRPDKSWYLTQFLAAMPLAVLAVIFFRKGEADWLVSVTSIVFMVYVLSIAYRMFRQNKTPIIATSEEGLRVRMVGFKDKYFKWDVVTGLEQGWFGTRLVMFGTSEPIPVNALAPDDREALLSEIRGRIAKPADSAGPRQR